MLDTCFIHLPGVGPGFAAKLNAAGVVTWDDAVTKRLPCGEKKARTFLAGVRESQRRLEDGDVAWFGKALAPAEQWRLFPHFKGSAAYVDIETTGLSWPDDAITTIALYDGMTVRTYVRGVNLEAFVDDVRDYSLLVTWNGRCFDAPVLRRTFGAPLDAGDAMGHLDLLPVFRALGLRGGLKAVEKALGLSRDDLDGVDGWAAVALWRAYERTGDSRFLESLLAYNVADVLTLEYLAAYAVMRHTATPMESMGVAGPRFDRNPFVADRDVLRGLGLG